MNLSFWLSLIICNVIRLLTFFFSCNDLVVGFDLILCSCWFSHEVGFPEFSEAGLARAASLPPRSSLLCSVHAGCTGEATCRPWSPGPVPTPVFSCPLSPFLCYPCLTQVLIPVSVVSPVWAPVLAGKPGGGGSLSRVYRLLQPARGPLAPTHCRMGRALLVPRFSPWPQAAHLLSRDACWLVQGLLSSGPSAALLPPFSLPHC